MADNQLILLPAQAGDSPASKRDLLYRLEQMDFIGAPLSFNGQQHYRPGTRFLQLLTFLGCSPVVALGEPGVTGDEFCHLQLEGPYEAAHFVGGSNVKAPRCPGCGFRVESWTTLVQQWQAQPEQPWHCPLCGKEYAVPRLRWRQCAGFGRFFLRIWGVFEGEAVPSEELLTALRQISGFEWQYFYFRRD
ncbi:MAG: hypothetical protein AB1450_07075 [Pseudomonadota bacterium]